MMNTRQNYSKEELRILDKLDALFSCWKETCEDLDGYFVGDGFYPNFLKQKPKILFIGRDAYDLYGEDDQQGECTYIEKFIRQYISGTMDGDRNINAFKFHKMLIQMSYGIIHRTEWRKVPCAAEICRDGRIFDRVSFAFMNICKMSHESCSKEGTNASWGLINQFLDRSITAERNYLCEEIELLNPDMIITLNLGPVYIDKIFGSGKTDAKCVDDKCCDCWTYSVRLPNRVIPAFDTWHFSSRNKREEDNIFNPVMNAWNNWMRTYA